MIKLVGESSVASGVRRVEAISGMVALEEFRSDFEVARVAASVSGGGGESALRAKLAADDEEIKRLSQGTGRAEAEGGGGQRGGCSFRRD